ncbi:magnesium transporter [Evansella sp. AB-P1]|uniref:magnesium transporter n=1 Tax=Evansella sp. AB-P1 TaxID=3037653 RepID=UPI00241EDFCF|nr:magnesium transporter [Evansella sp. AB-P1]MDG5785914.1 magnesium transporter [Evansella sp. AB-P1]
MKKAKNNFKNREEFTYYLFLHLKNKEKEQFRSEYLNLHPTDQIEIFKQISKDRRNSLYDMLSPEEFAEIFQGLELYNQKTVFTELEDDFALCMLEDLPADEITDFLGSIPASVATYLLGKMKKSEADNIKLLLSYNEDTAGSLMTTEFISLSVNETVSQVMERLRREGLEAETIYYLYVLCEVDKLIGVVSLRELITAEPHVTMKEIMKGKVISVSPLADQKDVSALIKDYDLLALPVVTSEEKMIGIVTVDDVIDVIDEENTEDIGEFAAVKGALDFDVSAYHATKKRLPWLVLLMFIGMLTAGLIGSFEGTLAEITLLALFIPLIADMAGNTGTQSLAVVVRGLALEIFDRKTVLKLLKREGLTGLYMGIVCGVIVSIIAVMIPQGNIILGLIVGVSLFMTIVVSTLTGTIIPLLINKLKIDPAVASGPFITTVNDVIALFIYFMIATSLLNTL